MPSALSVPCQTGCHFAPAAITPGISVTVTSLWLIATTGSQRHHAISKDAFVFMLERDYSLTGRESCAEGIMSAAITPAARQAATPEASAASIERAARTPASAEP